MSEIGRLADRMERVPGEVQRAVRVSLTTLGKRGQRLVKEGYLSGERLMVRSGRLRASVVTAQETAGTTERLYLRAGGGSADVRYAALQEYGGVVTPKNGKYLAIPLSPAKTRAGVARYASPRDVAGLFFFTAKSGKHYLGMRSGKGKRAKVKAWFALVPSVTIRPKRYMRDAMDQMVAAADTVIGEAVETALARVVKL